LRENISGQNTKFSSLAINSNDASMEGKLLMTNERISQIKRKSDKNNLISIKEKENDKFFHSCIIESSSLSKYDFFYEKNHNEKIDNDIKKFKDHNGNTLNESLIGKNNFFLIFR